jgi:hypothetical protein
VTHRAPGDERARRSTAPLGVLSVLELAAVLLVGLAIGTVEPLLGNALIVEDRMRGLLVSVRGVLDEQLASLLEALALTSARVIDRTPCRVGVPRRATADAPGLLGRGARLVLLERAV